MRTENGRREEGEGVVFEEQVAQTAGRARRPCADGRARIAFMMVALELDIDSYMSWRDAGAVGVRERASRKL